MNPKSYTLNSEHKTLNLEVPLAAASGTGSRRVEPAEGFCRGGGGASRASRVLLGASGFLMCKGFRRSGFPVFLWDL